MRLVTPSHVFAQEPVSMDAVLIARKVRLRSDSKLGNLDWKWIGIGVAIMAGLSLVGGLLIGMLLGPELESAASPEDLENIDLSGGTVALAVVINLLVFVIGGFIVGLKSAGRTVLEPGISAAIAVLIALLLSGVFTIGNLLVGGLVPFAAGVFGGWLGERRQERSAAPS
jgi:hypothetical protein